MITLEFREGDNVRTFERAIEESMEKQVQHFEKELTKIRTGRAHPSYIEDIKVSCYGSMMPLKAISGITSPEASLLVIKPWDKTIVPDIERALSQADSSLNPTTNGDVIRIQFPPMSSERRQEIIKKLHKKLEECKIAIRNIRKDFNNFIRDSQKASNISEDTAKRLDDALQKMTNVFIEKVQTLSDKKEKEIASV